MAESFLARNRKVTLSDQFIEDAYKLAAAGNYDSVIIQMAGIAKGTWYKWLQEGGKLLEDEDYEPAQNYSDHMKEQMAKLFYYVRKGQAEAEDKAVQLIQLNSLNDWKAAAWYLERKYSSRWGKTLKLEGHSDGQSKLDQFVEGMKENTKMTPDEIAQVEGERNEY